MEIQPEIGDRVEVTEVFNDCTIPIGDKGTVLAPVDDTHHRLVRWDNCTSRLCTHDPCTRFHPSNFYRYLKIIKPPPPVWSPPKSRWELIFE